GSISTDRQYIGERYDEETELNYLNARYYESTRGQFLSQDSVFWELNQDLTDPQSLNSYSYAENNPIVKSDPSGRCVGPLVAACIGAGGGLVAQFGADIYNNVQAGGWSNAFSNFSSGETYLTRAAQGFAIGLTGGAASGLGIAGQVAVVGGASGAAGVAGNWYLGESITLQSVAADTIIGGATFGAGKFVPGLPGRNPNFRTNAFYFGRHTQQSAMKLGIEGISGYTSLIVGSHNFSNTSASGGSPASQGAAKALGIGNTGSGSFVGTYNFGSGVGTYDFGSDKWVSTAQSTPAVK
ncbi:MAG: RHS repeat-associated core domain-containing protein, partial [Candidatus Paceibacterota bacterium]